MSVGMVATERLDRATVGPEPRDKSPPLGGRAILQAVTRVKLEQASKVKMRMPTRPLTGEGRMNREETDMRTCSVRRGTGHGMQEK